MRKKVKTPYNLELFPDYPEVNSGEIITVPDQSLTVREILDRHTRGLPTNVSVNTPLFDEDELILPDPRTLDLVDRQELAEAAHIEVEQVKRKRTAKPGEPVKGASEGLAGSPPPVNVPESEGTKQSPGQNSGGGMPR